MMDKLKVVYCVAGRGGDSELDDVLERALAGLGWERWASGFDLTTGKRDLAFERESAAKEEDAEARTDGPSASGMDERFTVALLLLARLHAVADAARLAVEPGSTQARQASLLVALADALDELDKSRQAGGACA